MDKRVRINCRSTHALFRPCFLCVKAGVANSISHGIGQRNPGESAAQRTEEPALPAAGPRQHVEGAARRDPQVTAAVHR